MRIVQIAIFLFFSSLADAQEDFYLPIDSSGYFKLIDLDSNSHGNWIKCEALKILNYKNHWLIKQTGKWGVVNSELEIVVDANYDTIYWDKPYFVCKKPNELEFLDANFKIQKSFLDFNRVEFVKLPFNSLNKIYAIVHSNQGAFLINNKLDSVFSEDYDDAFYMSKVIFTRKGNYFGFVSLTDTIVNPQYISMALFNDFILEFEDENYNRKYYFNDGRKIPDSDSVLQYNRLSGTLKIYKNGFAYLYDDKLKLLNTFLAEDVFIPSVNYFDKSKTIYSVKINDKIGACDSFGVQLIPPQYEYLAYVQNDRFIVKDSGKFGVINQQQHWIIDPVYSFIKRGANSTFILYNKNYKGVSNNDGKLIVPIEHVDISTLNQGIITSNGKQYGYYSYDSSLVLNNVWNELYTIGGDIIHCTNSDRECLIYNQKRMTPPDCQRVYFESKLIKYYTPDHIVLLAMDKGVVIDSTIFKRSSSVVIWPDKVADFKFTMNESAHELFYDQVSGKIGAINKEGDGFSIVPRFDNVFTDNIVQIVHQPYTYQIHVGSLTFQTKEKLIGIHPNSGQLGDTYLAFLGPLSWEKWHSSGLSPIINMRGAFKYCTGNSFESKYNVFMLPRHGVTSTAITAGEINLLEGTNLISYRNYFEQLNSSYNLRITSDYYFSLLSESPMIKIKKGEWRVLEVTGTSQVNVLGDYKYYREFETRAAIYSKDGIHYGVDYLNDTISFPPIFTEIISFYDKNHQYFYMKKDVKNGRGETKELWTVYDFSGQLLPEYYTKVEFIRDGFYLVEKDGVRKIIRTDGTLVYLYP